MSKQNFWQDAPLNGVNVAQAGAGSGKTHAIIHLYLRVLLQVPAADEVKNILTLTFTRAATAELQSRIRDLLTQSLHDLRQGKPLPIKAKSDGDAETIIRTAIHSLDEASIFTIHGFCKHVLEEYAFLCGQPAASELIGEDDSVGISITEDYWRQLYQEEQLFVSYVLQHYQQPMDLYQQLHKYAGRPALKIITATPSNQDIQQQLQQAHSKAKDIWQQNHQQIKDILQNSDSLNRNKYKQSSLPGWFAQMDQLLSSPPVAKDMFERFTRFCQGDIQQACKKDHEPPQHQFFAACQQLQQVHSTAMQDYAARFSQWQQRYIQYMAMQRQQRSLQSGTMGYHDLLLRLHHALQSERGEELAERLRESFPVALVDEFQDTDELQYRIFSKIYGDGDNPRQQCLFYVGDPKQAIYGFRGADIFSYIRATATARQKFTLDTNYRSHPKLVQAVNSIFMASDQPFAMEDIGYDPLKPHHQEKDREVTLNGKPLPPMTVWTMEEMPKNQAHAEQDIAMACADQIATLLNPENHCMVMGRVIQAADIAILVEQHQQGDLMRQHLARHGVIAVTKRQQSVYSTSMADQLSTLLHAIVRPHDIAMANTAMASSLLGHDALWLHQYQNAQQGSDYSIHDWHKTWQQRGFMSMFQSIINEAEVSQRVLTSSDGEQHLTDLTQLGELLQVASKQHSDPQALLQYLDSSISNSTQDSSESHQRRLQSDDNLVQIATVHASKGLEYPITFCPFHWKHRQNNHTKPPLFYHQDKKQDYQATLQLDQQQCDQQTQTSCHTESISEQLRKLYVSLTRASCHCTMVYAKAADKKENIFSTLLPQGIPQDKIHTEPLPQQNQQQEKNQATKEKTAPQTITKPQKCTAKARKFSKKLPPPLLIESFSSLSRHDSAELPDYDAKTQETQQNQETAPETQETPEQPQYTVHTMPAGATTGICLHSILEYTDFNQPPDQNLINQQLQLHGFSKNWQQPTTEMVHNTLNTKLFTQQLQLKDIPAQNRINEMEFIYPVNNISIDGIISIIKKHMDQQTTEALQRLTFKDISGYLKGFIDLVFTDGTSTWVVDYKSNKLGNTTEDYSQQSMQQAIIRENYTLQYLIYTLALHRYLKIRIKDYDYSKHHGGACYLFIRGLGNKDNGIFHYKPPKQLIQELDDYVG